MRSVATLVAGCLLWIGLSGPGEGIAEWYVAGQVGPTFADRLSDIGGTGSLTTVPPRFPNFDLKNSVTYGGKLGYFPGHGWFGLEADVFNTTPHIKSIGSIPGVHLRVTTAALNFIVRYPGLMVQPYAGVGAALIFSHIGNSATTQSNSDVSTGLNVIAGTRFFVTPYMALFTEYKYTQATLEFDKAFGSVGGFIGDYRAQHVVFGISYHF